MNDRLSERLRSLALESGIDTIGFADASPFTDYLWTDSKRRDPAITLPGAESIIVAGIYIGGMVLPDWEDASIGRTSRLYLSSFFLDVIDPLLPLKELLEQNGYQALICDSISTGTSSIPLKQAAIRAGLGWQGKHTLLITRKYGTFLALGGILTDAVLDGNRKIEKNRCGACSRCREACPMDALSTEFRLDVDRCLSYQLQVEELSDQARSIMGNRVGDCEICQEACPWNSGHLKNPLETPMTSRFKERIPELLDIFSMEHLKAMSEEEHHREIAPLRTDIPYSIFKRNISCTE